MGMWRRIFLGAVLATNSTSVFADDAVKFGIFIGTVAAIEDKCPGYEVLTDAVSGSQLSAADYEYAMSMYDRKKEEALHTIEILTCKEAAFEAVKLTDRSFFEVWTVDLSE